MADGTLCDHELRQLTHGSVVYGAWSGRLKRSMLYCRNFYDGTETLEFSFPYKPINCLEPKMTHLEQLLSLKFGIPMQYEV